MRLQRGKLCYCRDGDLVRILFITSLFAGYSLILLGICIFSDDITFW
jgi:hypothetical protein